LFFIFLVGYVFCRLYCNGVLIFSNRRTINSLMMMVMVMVMVMVMMVTTTTTTTTATTTTTTTRMIHLIAAYYSCIDP